MRVTVLGCGTSGGVPRIGNDWGACDPNEPKNRRRRCSILVDGDDGTRVLIDTSPDLREQLLDAGVDRLDGVVWTHEHADQAHGIDELRVLALRQQSRLRAWSDARTIDVLSRRFDYCFVQPEGSWYPPIIDAHVIDGPFTVGDIRFIPIEQDHGTIPSHGFRIGDFAYSNDVVGLSDEAFEALDGVSTWMVDGMRYRPHSTHANIETALRWIERVGPARAIITNMHVDLDYATLKAELPAGVEPAYDGMVIEF